MKKQLFTLFAATAVLVTPVLIQGQDLIVGVDQWRSSTTNMTPANYAVQDGVDVLVTRSGTDSTGAPATPGVNALGSTDGSIGSVSDANVSTGQSSNGESYRWVNGAQTARFDFEFTDTSGVARQVGTFHFDGGTNRPNVAQDWELFLIEGETETSLGTGTIPLDTGDANPEYTDFDVNMGSLLLDANGTITLSLRFTRDDTSGNVSGHNGYLDNVGLSTAASGPFVVSPTSIVTTRGSYISGDVAEISDSENVDYRIQRSTADTLSRTQFEVSSTSPIAVPTSLEVTLEGSVFARTNVVQTIELFNYVTGVFDVADTRNAARSPSPDSVVTVSASGTASDYVEAGTNVILARVSYVSDNRRQNFTSNSDLFSWTIE